MSTDHPDGTLPIVISRADIKTPIDFQLQRVGVYLKPDWEAKEGNDKNFCAVLALAQDVWDDATEYTVPTGKTLYITDLAAAMESTQDNILTTLYDETSDVTLGAISGKGGCSIVFSKPRRVPEDHVIRQRAVQNAEATVTCHITMGGYEI